MEPGISLPCFKETTIGSYPQTVQFNPQIIYSKQILILSSHLCLILPSGLFLLRLIFMRFSSSPCILNILPHQFPRHVHPNNIWEE